jgi:uncharacterized protein (DUF427 family)
MKGRRLPNPDHPISVESAEARVVVRIGTTILADTRKALLLREATLPPVYYIPREDVAMGELVASRTHTHCPYKGDASYFSAVGGAVSDVAWSVKDVAWSYEDPFDHIRTIKDFLAFYPDRVDAIEATPGG